MSALVNLQPITTYSPLEHCRMNGQPIPGFYFDQEKKKYFKIQSQAAARGLDLKYSTTNLRKEERKERVKKAATAQTAKTRKQRVVRRHASSFIQTDLEREIGFKRRSFYLHSIWPGACMSGVVAEPEPVTTNDLDGPTRFFDRDPVTKTIYAVAGENRVKRRYHQSHGTTWTRQETSSSKSRYSFHPWDEIGRTTSTISSFQYMPTSGALAVTTIGSDRPPIVQLSDPERDGPHISQVFTPKSCSAIWTSAARPASFSQSSLGHQSNTIAAHSPEHLAVAAQQSLLLFTRSPSGSWDSQTLLPDLSADILALEWLNHTTIALGCRNGKIHLHDTRSGGSSHILTHPYPISRLARADDPTRLLCSGLQDTLFLYDIRSPRLSRSGTRNAPPNTKDHHYNDAYFKALYPGTRDHKKRRKLNHTALTKWSQPVLSFPHSNLDDLDLGLAIDARRGLVAAAQDSANCEVGVRVSNLWTGKVVREFDPPWKALRHQKIRDLKWVDDEDGGMDLWSTWGGGIASFAW